MPKNSRTIFACTLQQAAESAMLNVTFSLRQRDGFSFRDSPNAAVTMQVGYAVLLSEDVRHGQHLDDRLQVIIPRIDVGPPIMTDPHR